MKQQQEKRLAVQTLFYVPSCVSALETMQVTISAGHQEFIAGALYERQSYLEVRCLCLCLQLEEHI